MEKKFEIKSEQLKPCLRPIVRACSCREYSMLYWLTVPEFADAIEKLLDQGVYITDDVVLPIMEDLYKKKEHAHSRSERRRQVELGLQPDFVPRDARAAINQIKRAMDERGKQKIEAV